MTFPRYFFLGFLLLSPVFAFAEYTPTSDTCFLVYGAGTAEVNGVYKFDGRINTRFSVEVPEFSLNAGTTGSTPVLTFNANSSGYYELRNYDYSLGYYYDSAAGSGSFPGINTTNSDGSEPTAIIEETECTEEIPEVDNTFNPQVGLDEDAPVVPDGSDTFQSLWLFYGLLPRLLIYIFLIAGLVGLFNRGLKRL